MRIWIVSIGLALLSTALSSAQTAPQPGQLATAEPLACPHVSVLPVSPQSTALLETRQDTRAQHLWVTSMVALVAASSADAATSWGKQEGNGLLASSDGTFGSRGVSIKAGLAVAVIVPQLLLRKHQDLRRKFMLANFVEAGIFTGISIHNLRVTASPN